jgi:2-dehydro-3-deoxygluconokinase
MSRLLCIGEAMVEMAPTGDGHYAMGYAGDTLNVAWYARRLLPESWAVAFLTAVGRDAISDDMLDFMAREGIGTGHVRRLADRTVGLYLIRLRCGERSFAYWRSQSAARRLAQDPAALESALAGADVVQFSGITLAILSRPARKRLLSALARALANGAKVVFDTNMRPGLWSGRQAMCDGVMAGARAADTVLPSFDEEQAAFGDATPAQTIARYRRAGARAVIVKNGGAPVCAWEAGRAPVEIAPRPVPRVVDSTAAGDSFCAAYLAAQAEGARLEDAVARANAVAGRVIGHRGALARDIGAPPRDAEADR